MTIANINAEAATAESTSATPTATSAATSAELETVLQANNQSDPMYLQAKRLIRTGRMENATFCDLSHILAVDEIEQRLIQDIAEWFDHYDLAHHSAVEANVALALIMLDEALDADYDEDHSAIAA